MSANKVLDLAEQQGLLDPQLVADLRKEVREAKFGVAAEALGNLLVEQGHLTAFQAKKLVTAAQAEAAATAPTAPAKPTTPPKPAPPKPAPPASVKPPPAEDLSFAEPSSSTAAPPAAEADEDLVMLEPAEPAPPPAKAPPPKPAPAPAPKPAPAKAPAAKAPAPAPTPKPTPAPEKPAPKPRAPAPAAPAPALGDDLLAPLGGAAPAPSGLEPLGGLTPLGGLEPLGGGLEALGSPADPFAAPADPAAAAAAAKPAKPAKKGPVNPWDSSLLLIGGGLLGIILIAFGLLLYTLTRGAAVDIFNVAEEEYKKQSYGTAIQQYEQFLTRVGEKDENAKVAKVKIGIAKIRQYSDGMRDPATALKTAQEQLPVIEKVERFADVREELASILPEIAEGFANQAKAAEKTERKEELVKLTDQALELVEHPGYISSGSREQIAARVANIKDARDLARRSIDQDRDLVAALAKMKEATDKGDVAAAYLLRTNLLKLYPGLEEKLAEATAAASARERQAVQVADEARPATTDDPPPAGVKVVLASLEGKAAAAPAERVAFVLVEGAVYALQPTTGKVLWRRYVGHETLVPPVALTESSDVLVSDGRAHHLLRLKGLTGKLVWKQALDEPFFAPLAAEGKVFVAAPSGKLLLIDGETGAVERTATFPQTLPTAPAYDAKRGLLVLAGGQSTIFMVDAKTLACGQSFFLGHRAGAVLAPPAVVLEHQLIPESPSDNVTILHILAPSDGGKQISEKTRFRLRGRLTIPLAIAGRRATAVTDLGEVTTIEIDPASKDSVRQVGKIEGGESGASQFFAAADPGRLWTASNRCALLEIQASLQKLALKWTQYEGDRFVAPPQIFGEALLHFRKRAGSSATFAECCQAATGEKIWETQLGSPLVLVAADEGRQQLLAVNSQGRVFEIPREGYASGYYDKTAYVPPPGTGMVGLRRSFLIGEKRWLSVGFGAGAQGLLYDQPAESNRSRLLPLANGLAGAAAAPVMFGPGLAVPLTAGRVELWDPLTARPIATPFQPPLAAGQKIAWSEPTLLAGGQSLVIGDGDRKVYRITYKPQPQPFLAASGEAELPGELVGAPATVGDNVAVASRGETNDELRLLQAATLAESGVHRLDGRVTAGPYPAGEICLLELAGNRLLAADSSGIRWTVDLPRGELAGPPLAVGGGLILVHVRGGVSRIDPATGKETAGVEVGEPLGGAVALFGTRLLIGGRDGVLHMVPLPQ